MPKKKRVRRKKKKKKIVVKEKVVDEVLTSTNAYRFTIIVVTSILVAVALKFTVDPYMQRWLKV